MPDNHIPTLTQSQCFLSLQLNFSIFKNKCKHKFYLPSMSVDWRSKSCSESSSEDLSLETWKLWCAWVALRQQLVVAEEHPWVSTNWTRGVVDIRLWFCLPGPAVENGHVKSQCWPCILKIDSVNNLITLCTNFFCWNKLSKLCRKEIIGTDLEGPVIWKASVTISFIS